MKKSWKKKWIEALRSGKYKRTTSTLRRTLKNGKQSYCCLGVLCDITAGVKWEPQKYEDTFATASLKGLHLGDDALSNEAVYKYGLSHADVSRLVSMNDDEGKSFKAIAKYIEKNL